jgi:diphthamide synthase (EF-2-diphthine--ammonia ligase)
MPNPNQVHILFWSGGKDSYLSYLALRDEIRPDGPLYLLTTFREDDKEVPYQGIDLDEIRSQVKQLEGVQGLIEVSLPADCPNEEYMDRVDTAIRNQTDAEERHLYFGDWKNEEIREWREEQFSDLGYHCHFPIWQKSLHKLLPELLFQPVTVRISWVKEEYQNLLRVEEPYNQRLITTLPKEIDPMGENGEFHTRIEFQEYPEDPMKQKIL